MRTFSDRNISSQIAPILKSMSVLAWTTLLLLSSRSDVKTEQAPTQGYGIIRGNGVRCTLFSLRGKIDDAAYGMRGGGANEDTPRCHRDGSATSPSPEPMQALRTISPALGKSSSSNGTRQCRSLSAPTERPAAGYDDDEEDDDIAEDEDGGEGEDQEAEQEELSISPDPSPDPRPEDAKNAEPGTTSSRIQTQNEVQDRQAGEPCWVCRGEAQQECAMCGKAKYCGPECQRGHWTKHRNTCRLLRPRERKDGPMPPRKDWRDIMESCRNDSGEQFVDQSTKESVWSLEWVPPGKEHLAPSFLHIRRNGHISSDVHARRGSHQRQLSKEYGGWSNHRGAPRGTPRGRGTWTRNQTPARSSSPRHASQEGWPPPRGRGGPPRGFSGRGQRASYDEWGKSGVEGGGQRPS